MTKNIVLIGFMGSGKSMVAKTLGQRLHKDVVATDELVEHKAGQSISAIFASKGEEYFRRLEHEAIQEASRRQGLIIDCGGGAVLNPENLKLLKEHGIVFHLQASPAVIFQRISRESHRPLLKVPDPLGQIKELYNQRLSLYNQADYIIDANDASIEGPVDEIVKIIG